MFTSEDKLLFLSSLVVFILHLTFWAQSLKPYCSVLTSYMHHSVSVCVATCLPMCAALRIHISAEVKHALDAVGGFRTEHRGLVDVKVCFTFIQISCHIHICKELCSKLI
jgi:hypothetical protein